MASFGLEGDGVIDSFFQLLWQKNSRLESCPSVLLPDTVVYKYRHPAYWYFTSAVDGQLKKKSRGNLANNKINESFIASRGNATSEIVSYYISVHQSKTERNAVIEFLDAKGLHDFLFNRDKIDNGFIQKFVEPKGARNSMIRAVWSPQVFMLERRVNKHSLFDRRFDVYDRAVTFEGPENRSEYTPVTAKRLVDRIETICLNVVGHIAQTTSQRVRISRMILNFKMDPDENLWFMFCSSLRLEDKFSKEGPEPLDLSFKFISAKDWVPPPTRKAQLPPVVKERLFECPNCKSCAGSDARCEITYKAAIIHYNPPLAGQIALVPPPKATSAKGPDTTATGNGREDGNTKTEEDELSDLVSSVRGNLSKEELEDMEWDGVIPPVIRQQYPNLKTSKFLSVLSDASFLYRIAYVCETCCLEINKSATAYLVTTDTVEPPKAYRKKVQVTEPLKCTARGEMTRRGEMTTSQKALSCLSNRKPKAGVAEDSEESLLDQISSVQGQTGVAVSKVA